ncbi:MAG TPA: cytochrome c oxidase subunit 3 [Terriglobales bacterium]|nr:cytochrome c oxidase subunit 3 [Terriglobales bacterium]
MATTAHETPQIEPRHLPDEGHSGDGGGWNLVPTEGNLRAVEDRSPEPARTGIWVALAAITMSFAALTSALFVRQGSGMDWQHMILPPILYANTLVLLASSVTLEVARRRIAGYALGIESQIAAPMRWLVITLALGLLFVAGQYVAWLQLKGAGLYLATNPNSSFFYVFTAVHALHVLGGLCGLVYVMSKLRRSILRQSTFAAAAQYWHFMDVLWLYLLWVLWMKL